MKLWDKAIFLINNIFHTMSVKKFMIPEKMRTDQLLMTLKGIMQMQLGKQNLSNMSNIKTQMV